MRCSFLYIILLNTVITQTEKSFIFGIFKDVSSSAWYTFCQMQNEDMKYTVTVRGFNQRAVGDFCGEAEKNRDKFVTAPSESLYENMRQSRLDFKNNQPSE